jgi:restriction system protein
MTIPNASTISTELLKLLKDSEKHTMKQVVNELAKSLNLDDEDITKMKKSGNGTLFDNRVNWAKYHLKKAGLVMSPEKGHVEITNIGKELIKKKDIKIDRQLLKKYDLE